MLNNDKFKRFRDLLETSTNEEIIWMNGFLSGIISAKEIKTEEVFVEQKNALQSCTILYGTETGNSKKVANSFSSKMKSKGILVKTKSVEQYNVNDLAKESCVLVVMSTQGDGEPPISAQKFYDNLHENKQSLSHLKYGVLALGDSGYPLFCKAGEDVDIRLNDLGAEAIISLKKCDTDFENDAAQWIDELLANIVKPFPAKDFNIGKEKEKPNAGKKIYQGNVSSIINLNDKGSNKETYHIEIVSEENIAYEPGDSLGIIAENNKQSVLKILDLLDIKDEETILFKEVKYKAYDLFKKKINIQYLPERIIVQYGKLIGKEIPAMRMDLADLLRIYPCDKNCNVQQYINILEPISPRLYSIASSPLGHGEKEIHITVARDKFYINDNHRFGLCSDFLSSFSQDDAVEFYIQRNSSFKLPSSDTDIILIGPGTGIAPFRSFLFERDAVNAEGRNWLFFGDQHFVSDFLYQTELQSLYETNVLTNFNTAFSRDQQEKIYVQHRMLQQANELFEWINNGANIYICGAKNPMSIDVENTLIQIISEKGTMSLSAATEYLQALHENGRYHKDVY